MFLISCNINFSFVTLTARGILVGFALIFEIHQYTKAKLILPLHIDIIELLVKF